MRGDRGFVTAEASMVLPMLVAFGAAMCACVMLGLQQVSLDAGAREIARDVARGDRERAHAVTASLPAGAEVRVRYDADSVRVSIEEDRRWDLPLVGSVGLTLRADSRALLEPGPSRGQ